jgi:hypothetical protein
MEISGTRCEIVIRNERPLKGCQVQDVKIRHSSRVIKKEAALKKEELSSVAE